MYNIYAILLAMVPPTIYVWLYVWIQSNPDNGINILKGISSWKRERRERYIKKYGEILIKDFKKNTTKAMLEKGFKKKEIDYVFKLKEEEFKRRLGEKEAEYIMGKPDETENFF